MVRAPVAKRRIVWELAGSNLSRRFVMKSLVKFLRDEQGTETLEWGLVCGLIVVGAIAAIALIGPKVTAIWNNVNSKIPAQTP
jgi:Flp pilus assembly pilin Flp